MPKKGSDSPEPRRSKVIRRAKLVIRRMTRVSERSDQRYSTCEIQGGIHIRSMGPSPSTMYAIWRSPLFA
jgi:hypothetical protein